VQSLSGDQARATLAVDEADAADFVALGIPKGSADKLRADDAAIDFTMAFGEQQKAVTAVCRAPWLLIEAGIAEAGIAEGRELTIYPSLRTDLENAGTIGSNSMVAVDGVVFTSRRADEQFTQRLVAVLREHNLQNAWRESLESRSSARSRWPGRDARAVVLRR